MSFWGALKQYQKTDDNSKKSKIMGRVGKKKNVVKINVEDVDDTDTGEGKKKTDLEKKYIELRSEECMEENKDVVSNKKQDKENVQHRN